MILTINQIIKRFRTEGQCYKFNPKTIMYMANKLGYTKKHHLSTKVIFVNDGPGLLLGTMWDDYSKLEKIDSEHILVMTLRMFRERLTAEWLNSK